MDKKSGFTLVELAIVLVIIGLMLGGVVAGRAMIRSSQLRAVATEVAAYKKAIGEFRDKYQALPGDFAGAEALWGSDTTCPTTVYTATPHKTTCNGDGDGNVGLIDAGMASTQQYESFRAWQHMADAKIIDASFSGISAAGSAYNAVLGVNAPASKLSGGGYTLFTVRLPTGDANNWSPDLGLQLIFGAVATNFYTYNPILTPSEALEMDTKLDDGLPGYGRIRSYTPSLHANCTTSAIQLSSRYNVTYGGQACALIFFVD